MDIDKIMKLAKIAGVISTFVIVWSSVLFRLDSIESLLIQQKTDLREVTGKVVRNSERISVLEDRSDRGQ